MTHPALMPPRYDAWRLINARVPVDLMAVPTAAAVDRLQNCDLVVDNGRIAAITTPGASPPSLPALDLDQGLVLPRLVDMHTHLDKGHIAARTPNPDGTHAGARAAVAGDREARWTREDVAARMDFALRCAFAHGTGAIRTHIDSIAKQTAISWPVFDDTRRAWKGRIALQAAALCPTLSAIDAPEEFDATVAMAAKFGGLIGGLSFMGDPPDAKLDAALDRVVQAAAAHGLDLDFHVDESDSPHARSLERIADAALRHRFKGRITAGHCCALALASDADRRRIIARVGEAGIAVVSLPMCNMYLQDRHRDRTPRWRGVAPLHELDAAGVAVAVASDNTRDPFYAYGDLDMLEVWREATRILHFDHSARAWPRLLAAAPADIMGIAGHGRVAVGGPADLILVRARTWSELASRPQSDRAVLVAGVAIDTAPPDYRVLDRRQG